MSAARQGGMGRGPSSGVGRSSNFVSRNFGNQQRGNNFAGNRNFNNFSGRQNFAGSNRANFVSRNFSNSSSTRMANLNRNMNVTRNFTSNNFNRNNWNRGNFSGNWNRNNWNRWGWGYGGWGGYGRWGYPFWGLGFYPGFGLWGWPFWGLGYYGLGYGGWGGYGGYGYGGYSPYNTGYYADNYGANYADATTTAPLTMPATDANSVGDFTSRGELAFQAGNYQEAIHDWQHALLDDPNNGAIPLLIGQAMFQMGQYENAAGAVQMAMQMLPENEWGTLVKNYTQLYPNIGAYTNQLKALEQARDAKPEDPALRFLLGYHFGYLGYPKNAVKELDKTLELQPKDLGAEKLRDIFAVQAGLPARPHPPRSSAPAGGPGGVPAPGGSPQGIPAPQPPPEPGPAAAPVGSPA